MTGPRIQLEPRENFDPRPLYPEQLRPDAAPVDTFTNPQAGAGLEQLARGLSALSPSLSRFSDVMAAKGREQAEADADTTSAKLEQMRMSYGQAVKQGVIAPNNNPFFQLRMNARQGRVAAGDYSAALDYAMKTDPKLSTSTNPQDFTSFENQFRKQWMSKNIDPDSQKSNQFLTSFTQVTEGAVQDKQARFNEEAGARAQVNSVSDFKTEVSQITSQYWGNSQLLAQHIQALKDDYMRDNPLAGPQMKQAILGALQEYALRPDVNNDNGLADVVKLIKTAPGTTLDADAGTMLKKVHDSINEEIDSNYRSENVAHEEKVTQQTQTFYHDLNNSLIDSYKTKKPIDWTQWMHRMSEIDPTPGAMDGIFALANRLREQESESDPNVERDAVLWAHGIGHGDGNFLDAHGIAAMRDHLSPSVLNMLLTEAENRQKKAESGAANAGSKLLGNKLVNYGKSAITAAFRGGGPPMTGEDANRAQDAIDEFQQEYVRQSDYIDTLKPDQQLKYVNELAAYFRDKHLNQQAAQNLSSAGTEPSPTAFELHMPQFAQTIQGFTPGDHTFAQKNFLKEVGGYLKGQRGLSQTTQLWLAQNHIPHGKKNIKDFAEELIDHYNKSSK